MRLFDGNHGSTEILELLIEKGARTRDTNSRNERVDDILREGLDDWRRKGEEGRPVEDVERVLWRLGHP